MATVPKDFRIKSGLVVDGTSGTINGYNILTESQASIDFIVETIGGTATSENTPSTVVKRDESGNFAAGTITADITGQVNVVNGTEVSSGTLAGVGSDLNLTATEGILNLSADGDIVLTSTTGDAKVGTDVIVTETATQTLTNKTVDSLDFKDGSNAVNSITASGNNLTISSNSGDIVIAPDNFAYIGSSGTAGNKIATQSYVDSTAQGLDIKQSVQTRLDTNTNLLAPTLITLGYRVLVMGQTNLDENGIYEVIDIAGDNILTRTLDGDPGVSLTEGAFVFVEDENTGWVLSDYATGDQTWTQFSGAGTYTAGTGLSLVGTEFSLDTTTDGISEGSTNKYYTDQRVRDVLTGSTQTNISITDVEGELIITAENGVADSTTDDLEEGTTNLYFTNTRAVDALEAVIPMFSAVDINSVARQVAATVSLSTAGTGTAYSWPKSDYRSAEFFVKGKNGNHTEVSKIILTLDTLDNIAITEYAMVGTNGSLLSAVTADISGTDVRIRVTTVNNNTDVMIVGTLLA